MVKKIGSIEEDLVITGGLLVGGWLLIKNFIPDLIPNLNLSPQDKQTLDSQQTATNNIFSGPFSPGTPTWSELFIDHNIPDGYTKYGVDNNTDFWKAIYEDYLNGNVPPDNWNYPILQMFDTLYHAMYAGTHFFFFDQDTINSVLSSVTNKWQVSALAELMNVINGTDLWKDLRYGSAFQPYGLNGTDLAAQVRRINDLPN